jgi:4-amino-4-deoxy-L-arabinose transferase-like glycosyltransferase
MNRFFQLVKNNIFEVSTAVAIFVFILCKRHDIRIPYHWDELGVYVPAAFQMKDTGHISLLPGSIDSLFSRGHPLLFTFSNALVFKIFGDTVTVGHIFALLLSILTLVLFFIVAKNLFNKKVAFISTILLSAQPIFFTLSAQLLPEMMITFFTLGCIYGIAKKKWILYGIFGSLAILTKESAIVIPATALLLMFIESIRNKDFFTMNRFRSFLTGSIPLFVFGIFLIIQKIQNGWFLFPEHIGYIHWAMGLLLGGAWRIFQDIFTSQGRWMIGIAALAGFVLSFFSTQLIPQEKKRTLLIFLIFILLAFIFADINYYLTRYILYVIPFVVLVGTYTVISTFEKILPNQKWIQWLLILLFSFNGVVLAHKHMSESPDTCDMSYKLVVNVSKQSIHWAEQNWSKDTIEANFPIYQGLEDPRNGYLTGKPIPYSANFQRPTKHGLLFFLWEKGNIPIGSSRPYHILKTFDDGYAHVAAVEYDKADSLPHPFK